MPKLPKRRSAEGIEFSDVAEWMLEQLRRSDTLYQEEAVFQIQELFGEGFCYENENGNLAIARSVLKEFRRLTVDSVVWERGERAWRWREPTDSPGRRAE